MSTALITGASHGIGKSIAKHFAKAGYNLYLNCHSSGDLLKAYCSELSSEYGVSCIPLIYDISDASAVKAMFDEINNPDIDILVNNAGISHVGLLQDMSDDEWNRVISTNLSSIFYTSRAVIPGMVHKKQGRIINISSMWGNVGASCEVAYSASKGGVNSFTKALAKELAPSNIQVNAISCGVIDTRMNMCFSEEERAELADEIPMGRFGSPDEVAKLALMLANAPEYMTGQILTMDGGFL